MDFYKLWEKKRYWGCQAVQDEKNEYRIKVENTMGSNESVQRGMHDKPIKQIRLDKSY